MSTGPSVRRTPRTVIVEELIKCKRFVYLCTNALLMPRKIGKFNPVAVPLLGRAHRRPRGAPRCVAYAYETAPDQEHFLGAEETRELFRKTFADGRRKRWRLNRSPLFLDFLEGKTDFGCTAGGIPSYSLLGRQRPGYLMDDGYAETYQELLDDTDWEAYGRGRDSRCNNRMAHCGYEPTAVLAIMESLRESVRAMRS